MARSNAEKIWELMDDMPICMLVTRDNGALRARPMGAYVEREEEAVYCLTDESRHKDEEIRAHPQVCLVFADTDDAYVSVSGRASISNDREKIADLWSLESGAWWEGPDDPAIRLITIRPEFGEYWETSGKLASYAEMLLATVTGCEPDIGDNAKARL